MAEIEEPAPRRSLVARAAFGAMVTLLGQSVGFFAAVQDWFQPFTGQGPLTWVLTVCVLALGTAAWVFVPRWWKWYQRHRSAKVISLALAVVLCVFAAGAGVATAAFFNIGGPALPAAPPATSTSATPPPSSTSPSATNTPTGSAVMTSTSSPIPSTTPTTPAPTPVQPPVAFRFDRVTEVPMCHNYHGDGTPPAEGKVALIIRQAQDTKQFFEREARFFGTDRWQAGAVTVGGPGDLTDFAIEAWAVTPAELTRLVNWPPNKPLDGVNGRFLTNALVTRTAAKNDC